MINSSAKTAACSVVKALCLVAVVFVFAPVHHAVAQQDAGAEESRAGAQADLTVGEAVRRVLETYPTVEAARAAVEASEARVAQARSQYWPRLSGVGQYRRLDPVSEVSLPGGPGGGDSFSIQPRNNYDAHLAADYTLYSFGRRGAQLGLAEAGRTVAEDSVRAVQANLALRAVRVFYAALFFEQRQRVEQQRLDQLSQALAVAGRRREAGTATDFEVLQAQTRISAARSQLTTLRSQEQQQKAALRQLLGRRVGAPLRLSGDFQPPAMQVDAARLAAVARQKRAEVQQARDAEVLASRRVEVAAASDNPSLDLNAQAGFRNGFQNDLNEPRLNQATGVSLRVPLFEGGRTEARVEEARAGVNASQAFVDLAERRVSEQVERAAEDLQAALDRLDSSDQRVEQARQALRLAQRRYRAGTITNLDLLDTVTRLADARLQNTQVLYQILTGQYALKRAAGTLLPFAEAR